MLLIQVQEINVINHLWMKLQLEDLKIQCSEAVL